MTSSVVSNSQITCFKRCRRRYWLTYVRKLKTNYYGKTGARQLGTRVHGALEQYYNAEGEAGRAAAIKYLEELRLKEMEAAPEQADDIESEHGLAYAMTVGYCDWIEEEGSDSDLEIIGTETVLRTPSPVEGIELIGKLDIQARKKSTGDEGFMDHKTVDNLTTPLKTLHIEEQFRMYAIMQRLLQTDRPPARFQIYNMLRKVRRGVTAEPPFFARFEVYINDSELRAFYERLYGELLEIRRFEQAIEANPERHRQIAYPTPTQGCSWDCDFFTVCALFDDDHSDPEYVINANYHESDPHEHYEGKLAPATQTEGVSSTPVELQGTA